eukprot:2779188-Rhodomonas_salina.2
MLPLSVCGYPPATDCVRYCTVRTYAMPGSTLAENTALKAKTSYQRTTAVPSVPAPKFLYANLSRQHPSSQLQLNLVKSWSPFARVGVDKWIWKPRKSRSSSSLPRARGLPSTCEDVASGLVRTPSSPTPLILQPEP